jgi:hypothetical protein
MKCFVTFRLRPEVDVESYLDWFERVNLPAVEKLDSITSYHVWQVSGSLDGDGAFEFLEEMEITDRAAFEAELDSVPEVAAMLTQWRERVTDDVVVYAEEVPQTAVT